MTDYGMPEADSDALDRAWTEEKIHRAVNLAMIIASDADPHIRANAEELSEILYELGIHLDHTAGYNITGGGS